MQSYYEESLKNSAFPFALTVQQGNTPYGYHWHDEFEISCVLSGHVAVHVGKKQYRLEPGDLLLIPGTVPHCFSPSDPAAARLAVKFGLALLPAAARREYSRHGGFAPHSVQWPPQTARRFRDILQRLRCEYTGVFAAEPLQNIPKTTGSLGRPLYTVRRKAAVPAVFPTGGGRQKRETEFNSQPCRGRITRRKAVGHSAGNQQ